MIVLCWDFNDFLATEIIHMMALEFRPTLLWLPWTTPPSHYPLMIIICNTPEAIINPSYCLSLLFWYKRVKSTTDITMKEYKNQTLFRKAIITINLTKNFSLKWLSIKVKVLLLKIEWVIIREIKLLHFYNI